MSARARSIPIHLANILAVFISAPALAQEWKADIGYDQLQSMVGGSLENGAGVPVSLVEANVAVAPARTFLPDSNDPQFTGKTIVNGSPSSVNTGPSAHATATGQILFGNTISVSGGVTQVTAYDADEWIMNSLFAANRDPLVQNFRVQNHSYIGNSFTTAEATNLNRRMDYMINRDNVTVVVGVNNRFAGDPPVLPQLFGQSYNAISVGRSDGLHSYGLTTLDGVGRTKPDIVAPIGFTSAATPIVGSVASLLHHRANNMGADGADATRSSTMKAIIMAGATKNEPDFTSVWSHTTTQPLDAVYGAGEVNVLNSYNILNGGEFDGSVIPPVSTVGFAGWDYGEAILPGTPLFYDLLIPEGQSVSEGTVLLTWNSIVTDLDPTIAFDPDRSLADLNLRFFDSSNSFLGTQLDASLSQVDNVELLWLKNLDSGRYTFEVSSNGSANFGLAWSFTAVPEPSQWAMIVFATTALLVLTAASRRKTTTRRTQTFAK